jgi:DNA invertase Pin-like site-specific DNA recombinase
MEHRQDVPKRAVLFIRVNRTAVDGKQTFDTLVDQQRERGQKHAERLGATIVREYIDRGGATELGRRNVLLTMLGDLAIYKDVEYVITQDLARLARNPDDLAVIGSAIKETDARIALSSSAIVIDET